MYLNHTLSILYITSSRYTHSYLSIMKGIPVFTSLLCVALCGAYTADYTGHQLWRVDDITASQLDDIRAIIKNLDLDVWASGKTWVDVRVTPQMRYSLGKTLAAQSLNFRIRIEDLQRPIEEERNTLSQRRTLPGIAIDDYNDLETIEAFMKETAATYDWVTLESIGKSVEGRDLWVNILSVPGGAEKPAAWIDCGIHAREWITHSTCVYGLDYLTKEYGKDQEVTQLLDKYDIYLMPVYNPDGYSFSWTEDRYWRKNRAKTSDPGCLGVDLNRNQDDGHWDGPYSSTDPCNDAYRGTAPFSEPESTAVSNYVLSIMKNQKVNAYFNLHSYSQLWMHVFGSTYDLPPENAVLESVSKTACDAIKSSHGITFDYGPIASIIYPANGGTADWGYKVGIVHSYGLELRDKASFILPKSEIIPAAEETWAGLLAAIMAI
ncbi:carboxypeptidase B-like [Palaemon carinicauda]|uniref:carboxypeptidase B-like n=1 Tax=Palaemon carinicauda TaxID=392227 RepID=UPI0035B58E92